MILYIVTDSAENYRKSSGWLNHARVLEDCADDLCLLAHYTKVSPRVLAELRPWAVCHSGGSAFYDEYDVLRNRGYRRAVRDCDVAQIGFCGGHQVLATFFGGTIGPMRRLRASEPDLSGCAPGLLKEWGVYPVRIVRSDPLFRGLGRTIRVPEYHSWQVKRLGPELVLLASSAACRVQAFVHRRRPVYGVQFHPEQSSEKCPDGLEVLRNFFRLARRHGRGSLSAGGE